MDVRCEKCHTEYELDEARLKPGGVTVKCTNCGHMFKIRKRSNTNVGLPTSTVTAAAPPPVAAVDAARTRAMSKGGGLPKDDEPTVTAAAERQWLIRLENGEQKSCRELATLQQWIIAGVVTPGSLISRSGKTWKMLGDVVELQQYFTIADEARATRENKPTKPPMPKPGAGTMLGVNTGPKPAAAGGTVVDDDISTTGNFKSASKRPTTPRAVDPLAETVMPARPATPPSLPKPPEKPSTWAAMPEKPAVPAGRSTAVWATDGAKPTTGEDDTAVAKGPSGGFSGRIAAITDEPAFTNSAGRVRVDPADESSFQTGKVRLNDEDDDDVMPTSRGSRAGLWIALLVLMLGGGGAAVYFLVIAKKPATTIADGSGSGSGSGSAVAVVSIDAGVASVTPIDDAAIVAPIDPLAAAHKELAADVESRLRDTMKALADNPDPEAQALRAHVTAQLAQDLLDRAGLLVDKAEAEALRKEAKTIVIDAATQAQKAHKAKPESGGGNVAMAAVLRLQGKRAADIKRYSDAAVADAPWRRDAALGDALVLARDGKLDDAKTKLAAIDAGDGKLETSGDVRARFHLALIAYAQSRAADAKQLNDQVLAAQPEHAAARALAARLETLVAKTDPLPPEDHGSGAPPTAGSGSAGSGSAVVPVAGGGGGYDALMAEANKVADTNCARALELYQKALDLKPDSVEAHTGMGYCFVDAKQFASAQSKFRTALRFSPRYEPALYGIAEAYQQQGRKDDAIEAYKAYLAVYPGTAKALKALERLGVTAEAGSATAPPPTPTPTPTPPPPPTPTPAPTDGSGSAQ